MQFGGAETNPVDQPGSYGTLPVFKTGRDLSHHDVAVAKIRVAIEYFVDGAFVVQAQSPKLADGIHRHEGNADIFGERQLGFDRVCHRIEPQSSSRPVLG